MLLVVLLVLGWSCSWLGPGLVVSLSWSGFAWVLFLALFLVLRLVLRLVLLLALDLACFGFCAWFSFWSCSWSCSWVRAWFGFVLGGASVLVFWSCLWSCIWRFDSALGLLLLLRLVFLWVSALAWFLHLLLSFAWAIGLALPRFCAWFWASVLVSLVLLLGLCLVWAAFDLCGGA